MSWMSTSFLLKFQFHMRHLYVKMPRQDRYLKFVMLAILLFLSLLFIAIEISGFENDIIVRKLLQIKCLCWKYILEFCLLTFMVYLWSIYFYYPWLYGPESPFTVYLIAMTGERIPSLKTLKYKGKTTVNKWTHFCILFWEKEP